jgi:hypothetical protein
MCSTPKAPKDPRKADPEYRAVATELGYLGEKDKKFTKQEIYLVDKEISQRKLNDSLAREDTIRAEANARMDEMAATSAANRAEDLARAQAQFDLTSRTQQDQFAQSMAAQERALQAQLAAQAEIQKRAEEASLRAQVPQMTDNSGNARRIRSKQTGRQQARQASLGTSQLRIPLSIGSAMGSGSPVKLNIGS